MVDLIGEFTSTMCIFIVESCTIVRAMFTCVASKGLGLAMAALTEELD